MRPGQGRRRRRAGRSGRGRWCGGEERQHLFSWLWSRARSWWRVAGGGRGAGPRGGRGCCERGTHSAVAHRLRARAPHYASARILLPGRGRTLHGAHAARRGLDHRPARRAGRCRRHRGPRAPAASADADRQAGAARRRRRVLGAGRCPRTPPPTPATSEPSPEVVGRVVWRVRPWGPLSGADRAARSTGRAVGGQGVRGSARSCRTGRRLATWRSASSAAARGSTWSIRGRMPVAWHIARAAASSSRVPMVEPITDSWRKKTRVSSARRVGPGGRAGDDDPSAGLAASAASATRSPAPTVSITTSTRSGSRAPDSKTSCGAELEGPGALGLVAAGHPAPGSPAAGARMISAVATPPPAPWTSTVCAGLR